MTESLDSMRRETVSIVQLRPDEIRPDPKNPNTVNARMMTALKRDIVEHGFVQPVLVRPVSKDADFTGYYIIDGEHRWRVLVDAGAKSVPCVIDDADEDSARLRLLTMNRLRGNFAPVKLAGVLAKLAEEMDEGELRERLGMDTEEWTASLEIGEAGSDVDERLSASLLGEAQTAPEVLTWRFTPPEAEAVEQAINSQLDAGAGSRADALVALLEQAK